MKKFLVLILVCAIPVVSFGQFSKWLKKPKKVAPVSLPSSLKGVHPVGMFAPHGYVSQDALPTVDETLRRIMQKELTPELNPQMSSLLEEMYSQSSLVLPENFSPEIARIAKAPNHPCILDSLLPYLYYTDKDSNLFTFLNQRHGTSTVRLNRNLDVFDPISKQFRTLPASSKLELATPEILAVGNRLDKISDTYAINLTTQTLQKRALNSSGKRSFLFEEELFPLALVSNEAMSGPILAARKENPGYGIFVQLTKPLVVFTEEVQNFKSLSEGQYFFVDPAKGTFSPAPLASPRVDKEAVFSGITKETLFEMLENDTKHFFFGEPYSYTSAKDETSYMLYRVNFKMALKEDHKEWAPSIVSPGDYLLVSLEDNFVKIITEKNAKKLLKDATRSQK